MRAPSPNLRRWLIRATGSALLLGVLAWFVPLSQVVEGFSRVPPGLFAAVLAAFVGGHVLAALKWRMLTGPGLGLSVALRAHFAGLASNLLLPGVAGGDAVRAALAQAHMRDGGRVGAGALADRMIDMLALACLAVFGALALRSQALSPQPEGAGAAMVALQVLALFGAALAGLLYVAPRLLPALWARFPALPAASFVNTLGSALQAIGKRPFLVIGALALSIAIQGLFVWLAMQLGRAVGLHGLPFAAWLFAWPLAKLLAVLPISLGGLGLREASLAALLSPLGAQGALVVAAGLVWQAVLILTGMLGTLVLGLSGGARRGAPPQGAKAMK